MPVLLLTVLSFGCATAPPAANADPFAAAPEDFSLDLTVLVGRGVAAEDRIGTNRPMRIVLFADGALHAEFDRAMNANTVPGYVRTLSRGQMASLWTELRQLGFAEPAAADPTINFTTVEARRNDVVTLLAMTGDESRWIFTRSRSYDEESEGAFRTLTDRLAALAWAPPAVTGRRMIQPERYDFGHDPYERYRR
ncbi:MAG: hypothetical protein EA377_06075 [Phycisphaerales bacterium]|nr:MAG: hypothetical protein EA377_06075 [Phycisphaerales bacterium]